MFLNNKFTVPSWLYNLQLSAWRGVVVNEPVTFPSVCKLTMHHCTLTMRHGNGIRIMKGCSLELKQCDMVALPSMSSPSAAVAITASPDADRAIIQDCSMIGWDIVVLISENVTGHGSATEDIAEKDEYVKRSESFSLDRYPGYCRLSQL